MSALVVIPARFSSTRFPGKPLVPLFGRPLIQHVYENARTSTLAEKVVVATDDQRIFEAVRSFGGNVVMTSPLHQSGTDRVAEAVRTEPCDIIVNVQGDEPLIRGGMIDTVIETLHDVRADISTLVRQIDEPEELADPNVVKAVFGSDGFALYFSRAPIPYRRDHWKSLSEVGKSGSTGRTYKHIGIYGYKREALLQLTSMPPTELENIEKLEQLRALEGGLRIKVRETSAEIIGVDTPQDLERVEQWLSISS